MSFSQPKGGASLLLAFRTQKALVIGGNTLAATRTFALLDADSSVTVLCSRTSLCPELEYREQTSQIKTVDWAEIPHSSSSDTFDDSHILDAYLTSRNNTITLVCVTDTLLETGRRNKASAERLARIAKSHGALVNVADMPELSDFAFTTSHRFGDSPLQVGVTTNGQGCRLASRLRREIVTVLPKDVGLAVRKVGEMRTLAKETEDNEGEDETCEDATPNRPVLQRCKTDSETTIEATRRRMKWVAQVSEYWPISRLATLNREEMREVLSGENQVGVHDPNGFPTQHNLGLNRVKPKGRILLVGSGPGHPSLLTLATHTALTKLADVVLSDKLVPSAVLELIPKHVTVRIARKFPGNAEGAQMEMMEAAIEAAEKGLTVVRLKQGDPVVYGRAGEEVLYFRERGYESVVIPGVSSALAAPTFAGIPVTQRGVAESLVICTGVGRNGKSVQFPGYERGRTLVVLMGVARLAQVVSTLVGEGSVGRNGPEYPRHTPIAIIERASMPDQRIVASTLADIEQALQSVGEQRPPGMFVVGWSVLALWAKGDVTVLEEGGAENDEARVTQWLGAGQKWRTIEGLESGWEGL